MAFEEPRKAYKKVDGGRVATLIVPAGTRVVFPVSSGSWNNSKLRVEEAIVDEIEGGETVARSVVNGEILYRVGERVTPHEFCKDVERVSAPGIHCFATYKEAKHW